MSDNSIENKEKNKYIELMIAGKTEEAREIVRKGLTRITSKMANLFLERQNLMGLIASTKEHGDAILKLDREYELIKEFSDLFEKDGEDPKMAEMLIWLVTSAGKDKQRKILERSSVFVKENINESKLLENLLKLTSLVATNYDNYGEGFSATELAINLEKDMLKDLIKSIDNKEVCIDLGSANGNTTRYIKSLGFKKVEGYEVSKEMIKVAESKTDTEGIIFKECNLHKGIPKESNSVDLVVSNFGAASEVHPDILNEVCRVLKSGGKAFLSFYNKDNINNDWWQPWQGSLEVIKNPVDDILEVPIIQSNGKINNFKIFAKSFSYRTLTEKIKILNLEIDYISSHSSISAMMPPMFFEDEKRIEQIIEFEKGHSKTKPYIGAYLNVVVTKK